METYGKSSLHAAGHYSGPGDFERLAFKYLYAVENGSTAIWCNRQCACSVNEDVGGSNPERGTLFFLSSILVFLIIHKCI